ncbi:response regulator [Flexistipes sinusarabici]|uniref:response regulator n=1 Tax=Flexistipes sinusarabici TaxID=2352 RepID=UPI00235774E3|nr:response regulator [Flexistipes sinusarabici]
MKSFNVLIVEDDTKISKIHKRFVEKTEGFTVSGIANTVSDATYMAEVLKPDLILLDVYFPEKNGLELLKYIRNKNYEMDIIIITASNDMNILKESVKGGIFDYIIKPVIYSRFEKSLVNYRLYKQQINKKDKVQQNDVDSILNLNAKISGYSEDNLPKGIDRITLDKIINFFCENEEGFTAENVGKMVGVSRSTARRYLEYLVSSGFLFSDQYYGSVGRPERTYFKK